MELSNISVKRIKGGVESISHVNYDDCCNIDRLSLLKIVDNCIFSEIVKKYTKESGISINSIFPVLQFGDKSNIKLYNSDNYGIYGIMTICLILSNSGKTFYCSSKNRTGLYCNSREGDCIVIDEGADIDIIIEDSEALGCVMITIYSEKPNNIDNYYINEDIEEKKVLINTLENNDFIISKNPIKALNNHVTSDILNSVLEGYEIDEMERGKKLIINYYNEYIVSSLNSNMNSDISDYININNYTHSIEDYNTLIKFVDIEQKNNIKDMLKKFNNKIQNNYKETCNEIKDFYEEGVIYCLGVKCNNFIENFIKELTNRYLLEYMNIKLDNLIYDTCIMSNENTKNTITAEDELSNKLVYTLIISLDDRKNEENIVIKTEYVFSNNIYVIIPEAMSIIGVGSNSKTINKLNPKEYIKINIYKRFNPDKICNIKLIKKYIDSGLCDEQYNNRDIVYNLINNNDEKCIYTNNERVFNIEKIDEIYKKYISKNKILHFYMDKNIIMIKDNNEYEKMHITSESRIDNEMVKKMLINIIKKEGIMLIDENHEMFNIIIYIFTNELIRKIEKIYGDNYVFTIIKCYISNIDNNEDDYKDIYNEAVENKKRNMIINVSINIDDTSDLLGMTLFTNILHNISINKSLNYIIECEKTENDIMNISEQNELIRFGYKNIEKIRMINKREYMKYHKLIKSNDDIYFNYDNEERSWNMYNNNIPSNEENIKKIIEDVRNKIIILEKINTNEIISEDLIYKIIIDGSRIIEKENENIKYNKFIHVMIQNTDIGGEIYYNNRSINHKDREYISYTNGIDEKYFCKSVYGIPQLILIYCFEMETMCQ